MCLLYKHEMRGEVWGKVTAELKQASESEVTLRALHGNRSPTHLRPMRVSRGNSLAAPGFTPLAFIPHFRLSL